MSYDLNILNSTNVRDPLQLTLAVNQASNNLLGTMILIVVYLGILLILRKEEAYISYIAASFITAIIATLMMAIEMTTWYIFFVPVAGLIVALVIYAFS